MNLVCSKVTPSQNALFKREFSLLDLRDSFIHDLSKEVYNQLFTCFFFSLSMHQKNNTKGAHKPVNSPTQTFDYKIWMKAFSTAKALGEKAMSQFIIIRRI